MNRKRVFILAVVIACVALAAVGTTAYETVVGTAVNIIEMGSVRFALHDETTGGNGYAVIGTPTYGIFYVYTPGEKIEYNR